MMRRLAVLVCAICLCGTAWAETSLKIITLHHRFAQDLLPAVQPLVGEDGSVSAIDNHLLVRASPNNMAAVEQAVAALDVEARMLRITVNRNRVAQSGSRETGVAGTIRRGNVTVQTPDRSGRAPRGVVVELGQRDSGVSESSSEFVSVLEGSRAVISVGSSVPFTESWVVLTRRYAHIQQTVQYRDITTGFSVYPRQVGEQVELQIAPRIASLSDGGVIEFQELATTVRLSPGEWFDLGGTMRSRDEVSRQIFSGGSAYAEEGTQLWIRVE